MLGRVRWELRWTSPRVLLALLRLSVLSRFAWSKEEGIVFPKFGVREFFGLFLQHKI